MSRTSDGIDAIRQYLEEQHAKGLIDVTGNNDATRKVFTTHCEVYFETNWGAFRKVIRPEVRRIAFEHRVLWKTNLSVKNADGDWKGTGNITGNSTYVNVVLCLYREKDEDEIVASHYC